MGALRLVPEPLTIYIYYLLRNFHESFTVGVTVHLTASHITICEFEL